MSIQIPWSQQLRFEEEGGGVDTARLKENSDVRMETCTSSK